MHSTFALAAFAAVAYGSPVPQEFSSELAPEAPAPSGCSASYTGKFQIAAVNVTSSAAKRDLETRQTSCTAPGSLTLALADGTLTDALNRIGYVASNYQFQFDAPPQAGTIYNTGFSACSNGTLALGGSSIFYQCLSGEFYNLYDRNWAPQCNAIYLQILPCGGATTPGNGVGQIPDGQVTGTSVGAAPITQIGDGQPQASTGLATVTQIADGQVQIPTSVAAPVTQIGDGQIQAPTGNPQPITQISDGQPQAPTGTASPITQIPDGQVQAPKPTTTSVVTPVTSSIAVITQIGDGQPQAPKPTTTLSPVTQIGDGQVQSPAGTGSPAPPVNASSTVVPFTGGAASNAVLNSGFAAVVLAAAGAFLL